MTTVTHEERIELYLSGADTGTGGGAREQERKFENALLEDDGLLERFIEACESSPEQAPDGLAARVCQTLRKPPEPPVPLPDRRMRAAMCFCGAAAAIVCTVFGPERLVYIVTDGLPEKFNQFLAAIQSLYM